MLSLTKTALEQFDNPHDFERMCADLLSATGNTEVVPIAPPGGSDGGHDITFTAPDGSKGLACVTLRKDIDRKFQEDFARRKPGDFHKYIFFCTAPLTHAQKLKFAGYCLETLAAEFLPQDLEALRALLDAAFPDIKKRYLHLENDRKIEFAGTVSSQQAAHAVVDWLQTHDPECSAFPWSDKTKRPARWYINVLEFDDACSPDGLRPSPLILVGTLPPHTADVTSVIADLLYDADRIPNRPPTARDLVLIATDDNHIQNGIEALKRFAPGEYAHACIGRLTTSGEFLPIKQFEGVPD